MVHRVSNVLLWKRKRLIVALVVVLEIICGCCLPTQGCDDDHFNQQQQHQQHYQKRRNVEDNNNYQQQQKRQIRQRYQEEESILTTGTMHSNSNMKMITMDSSSSSTSSGSAGNSKIISKMHLDNNRNVNNNDAILEMKQKLQSRILQTQYNSITNTTIVFKHQFLHLHHMKTAGTSIDELIDCSRKRLEKIYNTIINYANVHECDTNKYDECVNRGFYENMSNEDNENGVHCRKQVSIASIMSYCAPLKDLYNPFTWDYTSSSYNNKPNKNNNKNNNNYNFGSVTVLRHPIARVWSMYRFKTKECYNCKSLKQVYNEMDNPTVVQAKKLNNDNDDDFTDFDIDMVDPLCTGQLSNHMIRNMILSDLDVLVRTKSQNDIVQEAISNMKSFFTMVGITEQLQTTVQILGYVFPWLNETFTTTKNNDGSTTTTTNTKSCILHHENSSPQNNKCGPNDTHLSIPNHPDNETIQLIIQHNQLDIQLYDAAIKIFELQKLALNL